MIEKPTTKNKFLVMQPPYEIKYNFKICTFSHNRKLKSSR